jgi:AcrR family transcriptional regulator
VNARARSSPAPAGAPKRARDPVATQKRLLDVAEREFATRGFAGARLREVAASAGVKPALIHHYFADKAGLYRAVLDRGLLRTSSESLALLGSRTDLEGLVGGFVDLLVRFYTQHEHLLGILRHETVSEGSVLAEIVRERALPIVASLTELIALKQRDGEVRRDLTPAELILAALSMAIYPSIDAGTLAVMLPSLAATDAAALERRKRAITALLLSAFRP